MRTHNVPPLSPGETTPGAALYGKMRDVLKDLDLLDVAGIALAFVGLIALAYFAYRFLG